MRPRRSTTAFGDGTHRVEIGHVEGQRQELPAVFVGELLGEGAAAAFMGVRDHHVVAVGGEPAGNSRRRCRHRPPR